MFPTTETIFLTFIFLTDCVNSKKYTDNNDGKSSLVFVFDTTGSMHNDLKQLREGAEMILNTAMNESNIIADFVFVPFHDPAVGPATVTRDKKVFQEALNIVHVYGGGDCPEKSLTGIQLALNVSRPRSFVYVFTDATASDHRFVGKVLDAVQRKQSQVVFVLTGHCNDVDRPTFKVYQQIAAASSGQVFNLNKTSVHKVLEFVRTSIKARSVNLGSLVNPAGYNFTQEIPVDSTLGEVTVSVSGSKPQIRVVNPSGEELTGPPKLIKTLDLSEIMVVKVLQPEPGNWRITVGSEEDYSVKVVGFSNLTFDHGFSVEKPASIAETSYRPLRGTYNNMMIKLTQTDIPVQVSYAEILSLNGTPLFEVPLREVDRDKKVYLADAFMPPDDFFYIAINGRDQYNQELRRTGATAVQAKLPDVPYLTALRKMEVRPHERVVLICNVESLVPVASKWTKDSVRIQPETSSLQTTTIEFAIEDMDEEHVGTYVCSAHNVAGHTKTNTELVLLVDPPLVTIKPINATLELEEDLTISCTIASEALLLKYEMFFNGVDMNIGNDSRLEPNLEGVYNINKTIKSVDENNTGLYTCVATNRGGQTNQSTYIQVRSQPITRILGSHTLNEPIHSDIQIVCEVENTDTVRWVAPNSTILKENSIIYKNVKHKDVLTLKNVTASGVWQCMGFSGSYSDADSVEINIEMKPEVRIEGAKNITIVNGTSHVIVCIVEGKPAPRILWHRESEEFLNHSVTELKTDFYKSILTLNSSIENVEGTYFCIGENSQGIDQDSIAVNVRRKMTLVNGFSDISVELYYQVELQCEADSYPPPRVQWYHNGTELKVNNNLHLSDDNTTVYVKKVEFDNLGFYMCEMDNGFERITMNGTLSVHGLDSPTILKESSSHVARKGQLTLITCSVTGNPEPRKTWQYRNKSSDSFTSLPRGVIVNDDEDLSISSVALQHSGIYRCVADNVLGRDEHDTQLVVIYPPELSLEDGSVDVDAPREVEVGEKVQFSCKAVGSPPPMITWTKNGHPVVYTKNLYLTDANKLVLENATAKDAGVFTCKAKSALGSSERNYTLVVYMSPKITTSNSESQQEVLEGQLVELPCPVEGVPTPMVTWKQDDNIIEERRKYIDEFGLRFVANQTDSGIYSCTASNERGTKSLTYRLSVWVPPSIEPLASSKRVLHGTNVTIGCKAVGLPAPTIVWKFQEEVLKVNTSHVSFNDQGVLYISNTSSELEGNYTCVATNKAGVASQSIRLIINDPPELSLKDDSVDVDAPREVEVGGEVQFSCKAIGSPPPMITWTKNGHPVVYTKNLYLTEENGLVLENASPKDAGVFTCKAKSTLGSSERNYTLVVYMSPKITPNIESKQEVLEGQLVELPCSVEGVPTPMVTWRQDGNIIEERRKYIDEFGLRFVANQTDSGIYSCTASNERGTKSLTYRLSVWVPPSIEPLASSKRVLHGTNVTIGCKAVGLPAPTIAWKFQEEVFKANTSHVSFNDQGVLYISNASSELEGNYTCVATNKAGVASQSIRLIINDPPELSLKDDSVDVDAPREVEVGGKVQFSCKAIGSPPPMITWTKNGHPVVYTKNLYLTEENGLVLENASPKDAGVFTCKAKSTLGSSERNYTLVVYMSPKITPNIESKQEVLEGQLIELPCSVEGVPTPMVTWRQDGNIIEERRKYIDEFGLRFVANQTDSGIYSCTASNERGTKSLTYRLSVWVPPSIEPLESFKRLLQGTNVMIGCKAVGLPAPTIVWKFQEEVLKVNTSHVSFNDQGVLYISNASSELEGNYTCVASNKAGVASQSIILIINDPPELSLKDDSVDVDAPREVEVGGKVQFSCKAIGSPPPMITWTKNGHPVVYTKNLHMTDANDLVLENATAKDAGVFTCKAKSALGSSERNYTLVVYMRPNITIPNIDPQQEVSEGQLVELPCSVEGVPTPIVTWKQDDNIIEERRKYIDEFGLRFVANLSDFGNYSCTASNEHGMTSLTYALSVWVPPSIGPLEPSKEVLKGTNMTVECNVVGFPIPTIVWEFHGKLLTENTSHVSFNDQGVLSINNASSELEGVYSCVAENNAGVASQSTRLIINEPPKILSDNYTGSYLATNLDTAVTVACQATGKPKPYVIWSKDDFYLDRDSRYNIEVDGSLTINSPTEDLSGNYTCTAKNSVGKVNKTVAVEIYSLPITMQSDESLISLTVLEGTNTSIQCPAQATHSASINWYKDAKLISQGLLNISNVSRNDASTYACVVKNAIGSALSTIQLKIEWPPKFLMNETRDIEVVRGDDRYLDCGVDSKPKAKTRWLFNSKPILFEDKARFKLMNIQLRNTGIYKCIVSNIHGTVVKQFTLDVLVPPFISEFDLLDVQLKEGSNATLECNARGSPEPKVSWTFHNEDWHMQNSTITAVHVTSKSEGLFRCDASNKAGSTHIVYRVKVVSDAKITEVVSFSGGEGTTVDNSVDAVLGTHLRVSCIATGEPRPDVQWIRNGIVISRNSKSIDYADLVFNDIQRSNSGVYSCIATNEGESHERRIKINILEPPKIFQNLFETPQSDNVINLEVISGQAFYLHCHPYGNPMPEVYWFRDEIPLKLFDETMVSSEFGEVLTVKSAMFEQSGNYTCVARNSVGNSSIVYLVDVLVPPPTLKESSKKVSLQMGRQLNLTCPVQGSPIPYAMWVKHPYIEISEDTPRVQLLNENYTLIINDTDISDSGRYTCIMTNKVGTTEFTFNVTIRKPPTIAGNLPGNNVEDHIVPLRRSIVLKCETDGNPLPIISWLKDTQQLSDNLSSIQRVLGNSLLSIRGASVRDAGQYICVVENEAGSAHRRYNVAVQVPGKLGPWSQWSTCNVTCGAGSQLKYRSCYYVDDDNNTIDKTSQPEKIVIDESGCRGQTSESRKCHMPKCEVVSEAEWWWSAWGRWSACSATCGVGTQARTRTCTHTHCTGDNVQIRKCPDLPKCSRDPSENEVYSSGETNETDSYLPEATFEMEPDIGSSQSPFEVEEFTNIVIDKPPVYFDVNVTVNLDGSENGPCDFGYSYNPILDNCDDIDECLVESNQCHSTQVCVNTKGAYRCTCQPGFESLGAGQRCLDINECTQELHGCQFACVNVAGGHVCACPTHLRLHRDKHHCVTPLTPSLYQNTNVNSYEDLDPEVYLSTSNEYPVKYTRN